MADTAALLPLLAALTAGDVSVTREAIKRPDSQVVTTPGSANDALWSELVRRGWMVEAKPPDGLAGVVKTFTFTRTGRQRLPEILPNNK